jgi:TetR/AcrR family transcriptional regulator of autoinduction and epiphytic fitness
MSENTPQSHESSDGRVRRAQRTREAMLDAMITLIDRGNLRPTADEVAKAAGVGIRTVFRHFTDMETLYGALSQRSDSKGLAEFDAQCPGGPLEARIRDLLERRTNFLERYSARVRASSILRQQSPVLERQMLQLATVTREQMFAWLPELKSADPSLVNAIEAALSWSNWEQLRREQCLSADGARGAIAMTALALTSQL